MPEGGESNEDARPSAKEASDRVQRAKESRDTAFDALSAEEARGRLAAIVESSDDAIVGKNLDGIVTSWNAGAERIFGYTADEMIGQSILRIIPPDRVDDMHKILAAIGRGERIDHFESERVRKDGRRISVSLTVSPIRDARGRIIGASKIARDVTEQKRAARELERTLRELSTLYAVGQTVAAELDREKVLRTITDAATDLSGAKYGAFFYNGLEGKRGHYLLHVLTGAPREAFEEFGGPRNSQLFARTFTGREIMRLDDVRADPRYAHRASHHGAPPHHLPVTSYLAVPVVIHNGEVLGGLVLAHPDPGVFTEESERVVVALATQAAIALDNAKLYAAEQRARSEAEQASNAKDHFLAMLSHELRNPLASIRNALHAAGLDQKKSERALGIARHGADQLSRLVDDLLDVTRITQARIPLRKELLSFGSVVEHAIDATQAMFKERSLTVTASLPSFKIEVEGDAARLEQVVGNLLTNAAKYTEPRGRITIGLEYAAGSAVLRVRDTGIGISPELLPRIFEVFVQGEQSMDRARGGLGLGLTLVKQLVEMHGGHVEVRSEGLGRGAEFTVRLPARRREQAEAAAKEPKRMKPATEARVLIVEDNADAAESLMLLLELLGLQVRTAPDGPAALDAARASRPDLMLIDIGLPGMNGYELAEQIRHDDALRGVTLVALTGYGQEEDRQRALAAGFDHHMVKPINVQEVEKVVASLASSSAS